MFRKLSKIVTCGSIAIFCTLFANPNQVQNINTCYAQSGFSSYWYQDTTSGNWRIHDGSGSGMPVVSAWVCDNALNPSNVNDNWYLMDAYGNLCSNLIFDGTNYFLMNPSHDGSYGKLISSNDYTFNGATFQFDQSHSNGTYGKILNPEVIAQSGLPVTQVSNTTRVLYTANFSNVYGGGTSGSSGNSGYSGSSSSASYNAGGSGASQAVQQSTNTTSNSGGLYGTGVDEYGYSLAPASNQPIRFKYTEADLQEDKKAMSEYMSTHDLSQVTFY